MWQLPWFCYVITFMLHLITLLLQKKYPPITFLFSSWNLRCYLPSIGRVSHIQCVYSLSGHGETRHLDSYAAIPAVQTYISLPINNSLQHIFFFFLAALPTAFWKVQDREKQQSSHAETVKETKDEVDEIEQREITSLLHFTFWLYGYLSISMLTRRSAQLTQSEF